MSVRNPVLLNSPLKWLLSGSLEDCEMEREGGRERKRKEGSREKMERMKERERRREREGEIF